MVWYSHLLRIFHSLLFSAVKGFSIVSEAEVDIFFLELSCFFCDPVGVGSLISSSFALCVCIYKYM